MVASCTTPQAVVVIKFGRDAPSVTELRSVVETSGMECIVENESVLSCRSDASGFGIQSIVSGKEGGVVVVRSPYQGTGPEFSERAISQYGEIIAGFTTLGAATVELIDFGETARSRRVAASEFTSDFLR